jgi:hypothetical protein
MLRGRGTCNRESLNVVRAKCIRKERVERGLMSVMCKEGVAAQNHSTSKAKTEGVDIFRERNKKRKERKLSNLVIFGPGNSIGCACSVFVVVGHDCCD